MTARMHYDNDADPAALAGCKSVIAGWLTYNASAARDTEPSRAVWQNARRGFRRSAL